jgi:hypothetical protein
MVGATKSSIFFGTEKLPLTPQATSNAICEVISIEYSWKGPVRISPRTVLRRIELQFRPLAKLKPRVNSTEIVEPKSLKKSC